MSSIGAVHVPEKAMSTISKIMLFEGWAKPDFLALFLIAAFLGSVLNYSIFLCTTINSALTTAVVGCLKNVLTTYIGMIVFPDYVFEWMNFIGLNISIAGSLYYTYFTMFKGFQGFGQ
jgi:solute carrier family 35 protein